WELEQAVLWTMTTGVPLPSRRQKSSVPSTSIIGIGPALTVRPPIDHGGDLGTGDADIPEHPLVQLLQPTHVAPGTSVPKEAPKDLPSRGHESCRRSTSKGGFALRVCRSSHLNLLDRCGSHRRGSLACARSDDCSTPGKVGAACCACVSRAVARGFSYCGRRGYALPAISPAAITSATARRSSLGTTGFARCGRRASARNRRAIGLSVSPVRKRKRSLDP